MREQSDKVRIIRWVVNDETCIDWHLYTAKISLNRVAVATKSVVIFKQMNINIVFEKIGCPKAGYARPDNRNAYFSSLVVAQLQTRWHPNGNSHCFTPSDI